MGAAEGIAGKRIAVGCRGSDRGRALRKRNADPPHGRAVAASRHRLRRPLQFFSDGSRVWPQLGLQSQLLPLRGGRE